MRDPCNLKDLYVIQNASTSALTWLSGPFGYFVRIRYIDLKLNKIVIDTDQLESIIQAAWYDKNKASSNLQLSLIRVITINQDKYTSSQE